MRHTAMGALQWAENLTFPNTKTEREFRRQIEDIVHAAVAHSGQYTMTQAGYALEKMRGHREEALDLKATLDRIAALPADGTLTDQQIAEYDRAANAVDRLVTLLEGDAANAEWTINRLENPLETLTEMQTKYGPLMLEVPAPTWIL